MQIGGHATRSQLKITNDNETGEINDEKENELIPYSILWSAEKVARPLTESQNGTNCEASLQSKM